MQATPEIDSTEAHGATHVVLATGARDWQDDESMTAALRELWRTWVPSSVATPLLVVGDCPTGADSMIAALFASRGFAVHIHVADWSALGRRAGPVRNQAMVDMVAALQAGGALVAGLAFQSLCTKCAQVGAQQQLLAELGVPGHFSHGTNHCRSRAIAAGVPMVDVLHSSLQRT